MKDLRGDSSELGVPSVDKVDQVSQRHALPLQDEAFRAAYDRHASEILRYAIRCTGRRDIAEELASEAFLKMYVHRQHVDFNRAGAWLTAAVKNMAIDYWRRMEVERRPENLLAASRPLVSNPEVDRLREILGHPALKVEHRVCLTLHYVHGMENREITQHTGLSQNQVKSALQYGLRLLRNAYRAEDRRKEDDSE
ncbi:MAG: sigma-70 family RNA polymerase sigma factor [Acidobacteria bacterium]|nr:sigma-70 family RNA polymerase sigma factor [Acidobacteriota bacterium]